LGYGRYLLGRSAKGRVSDGIDGQSIATNNNWTKDFSIFMVVWKIVSREAAPSYRLSLESLVFWKDWLQNSGFADYHNLRFTGMQLGIVPCSLVLVGWPGLKTDSGRPQLWLVTTASISGPFNARNRCFSRAFDGLPDVLAIGMLGASSRSHVKWTVSFEVRVL